MDQKIIRDMAEKRAVKNNLVSGVDRSDKIRTYNYAQVRFLFLLLVKRPVKRPAGTSHRPPHRPHPEKSVLRYRR